MKHLKEAKSFVQFRPLDVSIRARKQSLDRQNKFQKRTLSSHSIERQREIVRENSLLLKKLLNVSKRPIPFSIKRQRASAHCIKRRLTRIQPTKENTVRIFTKKSSNAQSTCNLNKIDYGKQRTVPRRIAMEEAVSRRQKEEEGLDEETAELVMNILERRQKRINLSIKAEKKPCLTFGFVELDDTNSCTCLLYTSPSPRD
eukprot:TRINITY_DN7162_c0_g1_i10.p1 TRINITY_DN7162_c0_g1~~TRINITY_DN7162_c0_g1_i10.p1  ORF type:complete len:201 (-),score=8.39 TRINITY_DN7162_c0_g1_i10:53-655(-)